MYFFPTLCEQMPVISLWVWGGLGTSSTMAFVQMNDLKLFLGSENVELRMIISEQFYNEIAIKTRIIIWSQ